MKISDTFAMGARSLKERPLETGLIILGIALSACVASASLLLLGSQSAETERLLQGPAYREIVVQTESGNGPDSASALREITQSTQENISFSDNDIETILASTPQIRYNYKASGDNMRVNGFGGPGALSLSAPPAAGGGSASSAASGDQTQTRTLVISDGANTAVFQGGAAALAGSAAAASPSAPANPGDAANPGAPPEGIPGGPDFTQGSASVSEGETLLTTELTEFRNMQVSPEFFQAYGVEAGHGALFTDTDAQNNTATIVLGELMAARMFPDIKADSLIGRKIRLENRIYVIAAILSPAADKVLMSNGTSLGDLAYTPVREMVIRNGTQVIRFNRGNSTLRFAVADSSDLAQAYASLSSYFETTYGIGKVRITVPFDEARLSRDGFDRLLWLIVAFGIGALLMALINLMNMMLTRALRRQAILGILGAMGASQLDLTKLQTVEGGLMAAGGSLAGIALSIPFYGVLYNAGKNLFGISGGQAPLDPLVLAVTAPVILLIGLVLALIPAWQSSNTPITAALRSE